jgi:hypothetical protein
LKGTDDPDVSEALVAIEEKAILVKSGFIPAELEEAMTAHTPLVQKGQ